MNSAILFAFGSMLAWGIGDFLIQKSVKRIGNFETMAWIGAIAGIALTPFVLKDIPLLCSWNNFSFLFLLGLILFAMNYFAFEGYRLGKLSVTEVVASIELPLSVLLGVIIFSERPSFAQALLIIVIFSGVFIVSKKQADWTDRVKKFFTGGMNLWEKGVFFALVGGLLSAFVNLLIAFNSREITPLLAIWFPWTVFAILALAYICFKRGLKNFWSGSRSAKGVIFSAAAVDALAWIFFALALADNDLSITTAVTESYPALAMFLGIRFNKEKISKWQLAGGLAALAASIIIGLIS